MRIETVQTFDKIKILADEHRMAIMQLLMASTATLTQLARSMEHSPAWVRHHLKILESDGFVEMAEVRTTGRVTEKFYRARAGAMLLHETILPRTRKPSMIFSGSHDLAVEGIAQRLAPRVTILSLPVGSLDGLVHLRQGVCQVCGTHLLDESGEYNLPYVKHFFPDRRVKVITLAHRTQGLMLRAGNPKRIRTVEDLRRPEIRFVNRNAGSGTRLWLDRTLQAAGISPQSVRGYRHEVKTHTESAATVEAGQADAAIGLQAAAQQSELDFVPLFEERYDLVLADQHEKALLPFLDYIQTADFRSALSSLAGYNSAQSGTQIPI